MKKEFNIMPQTKLGLKQDEYEKRFYFDSKIKFEDIRRVISLMARFGVSKTTKTIHTDYYYETDDHFFAGFNASVRMRKSLSSKSIAIHYEKTFEDELGEHKVTREYERPVPEDSNLVNDEDAILFLEDKIREVYTHHVDMQVTRKIKEAKVFMVIQTERLTDYVKNNNNFTCKICYDDITFKTKRSLETAKCIEVKLTCVPTEDNLEFFERFLKELRNRVVLYEMKETKYNLGLRVTKFKKENRKQLEEELEEFRKKYPPFEDEKKKKKKVKKAEF